MAATEAWPLPTKFMERQLAASAPASDASALLVVVFNDHYAGLCRLAFLILGDRTWAEDVVQEAFVRTFAGWARIRNPDMAPTYLRRAVINLARSRTRRRFMEGRVNALAHQAASRSPDGEWEDGYLTRVTVVEAVRLLPARQQATIILRYFLDLPEAEIARVLDVHVGTVKSQLAKARKSLEALMPDPLDD